MSDQTFEQSIIEDATQAAAKLIEKHPELRGVCVVFDWNLSDRAADGLSGGLWKPVRGEVTPHNSLAMCLQLTKMLQHLEKTSLHVTSRVLASLSAHLEEDHGSQERVDRVDQ